MSATRPDLAAIRAGKVTVLDKLDDLLDYVERCEAETARLREALAIAERQIRALVVACGPGPHLRAALTPDAESTVEIGVYPDVSGHELLRALVAKTLRDASES